MFKALQKMNAEALEEIGVGEDLKIPATNIERKGAAASAVIAVSHMKLTGLEALVEEAMGAAPVETAMHALAEIVTGAAMVAVVVEVAQFAMIIETRAAVALEKTADFLITLTEMRKAILVDQAADGDASEVEVEQVATMAEIGHVMREGKVAMSTLKMGAAGLVTAVATSMEVKGLETRAKIMPELSS